MFRKSLVALASVALVFLLPHGALAAMSCDRVGAKSQLHYGSQVGGQQVRICGEYWLKFAPKPVAKPTGPPKVYPKSFVARPLTPAVFRDGSEAVAVHQSLDFWQNAIAHSRENMLMGFRTEVRFRPVVIVWEFSDRWKHIGLKASHAFAKPGVHWVRVQVTYAVKYRFIGGTKWIREPRTITINSPKLAIRVSEKPIVKGGRLLLVRHDCLVRPRAIAC